MKSGFKKYIACGLFLPLLFLNFPSSMLQPCQDAGGGAMACCEMGHSEAGTTGIIQGCNCQITRQAPASTQVAILLDVTKSKPQKLNNHQTASSADAIRNLDCRIISDPKRIEDRVGVCSDQKIYDLLSAYLI